jgi:hypothetical protein
MFHLYGYGISFSLTYCNVGQKIIFEHIPETTPLCHHWHNLLSHRGDDAPELLSGTVVGRLEPGIVGLRTIVRSVI